VIIPHANLYENNFVFNSGPNMRVARLNIGLEDQERWKVGSPKFVLYALRK